MYQSIFLKSFFIIYNLSVYQTAALRGEAINPHSSQWRTYCSLLELNQWPSAVCQCSSTELSEHICRVERYAAIGIGGEQCLPKSIAIGHLFQLADRTSPFIVTRMSDGWRPIIFIRWSPRTNQYIIRNKTTAQQKGNVEVDGGRLLILNRQTFQNDLAVSRRCPLA